MSSQYILKQFVKGIALQGESADVTELVEGSLFHNSTDQRLKSFIEGQTRQLLTDTQVQDMSNKTHLGLFKIIDSGGTIHLGTSFLGDTENIHIWSVFNNSGKTAQFGSWLSNGSGGATVFSGSAVRSTDVGDGVYTSGNVTINTRSSILSEDAANIVVNSGEISISTASGHATGSYSDANSGNIQIKTGESVGNGERGEIKLNSKFINLISDIHTLEESRFGLLAASNITFVPKTRPELPQVNTHEIRTEGILDINILGTPTENRTNNLLIYSGPVLDPNLTSQQIDTGNLDIFTGAISHGTGASGNLTLYTGNSANSNSGDINIFTGESGTANRGFMNLSARGISLISESLTSTANLQFLGNLGSVSGVYSQGIFSDYIAQNSPSKTAALHLVSGGVQDSFLTVEKVDSGEVVLFSGGVESGTGDSGSIILTSGPSLNGNSGNILLQTSAAPNGERGKVIIDAANIDLVNTNITNLADPTNDQDAATKNYVDSEIISQDVSIRSYVDSQVATKADLNHTHDLVDINQSGATVNQIPVWNGTAWTPTTVPGVGSLEFTNLSDVPVSYAGEAGKLVAVKTTEDGLEFISSQAGETNTASNVGIGSGIYKEKIGVDLRLKSITQGTGILVTANADDIEIASSITQYTDNDARAAAVEDAIVDGVIDKAPSQNAVFDALALKQDSLGFTAEDSANKSTDILLGISDTLYPTQNAVKSYVDSSVSSIVVNDATSSTKGIIQLAGDLGGTASSPTVPALADKIENAINLGTGEGLFSSKVGSNLELKSLVAGNDISLTSTATGITIHNTFVESVSSVNNKTGVVVLDKTDIGLSNVDNTSDAQKVSTGPIADAFFNLQTQYHQIGGQTYNGTADIGSADNFDFRVIRNGQLKMTFQENNNVSFGVFDVSSSDFSQNFQIKPEGQFKSAWLSSNLQATEVLDIGAFASEGNGGELNFIGPRVKSQTVGDGEYTAGNVNIRSSAQSNFEEAANVSINSGNISLNTANGFAQGAFTDADSGNILLSTGLAAGAGARGEISMEARSINLFSDSILASRSILFLGINDTTNVLNGLDVFNYVGQGTPNKSADFNLFSGNITDTNITTEIVNSGNLNLNTGNVLQGNGSTGNVLMFSGDSKNKNTGSISISSGWTLDLNNTENTGNVNISTGINLGQGQSGSCSIGSSSKPNVYLYSQIDAIHENQLVTLKSFSFNPSLAITITGNNSKSIQQLVDEYNSNPGVITGNGLIEIVTGASLILNDAATITLNSVNTSANTGNVSLNTGDIQNPQNNSASGNLSISTGNNSGIGDSGQINIVTGDVSNGNRGSINLAASSVALTGSPIFYLGNPTTTGTWRFIVDAGNLLIQVFDGITWVTKQTYNP